ncbi:MAG: HAMP domain-containing histidine kinase [Clostridia bacterium]|nr:HAMP domain-containing histidine kinase [Clostridia bacterium]
MKNRFRKNFIIIAFAVLTCVFIVFFGIVNIVTYYSISNRAEEVVDLILDNDGILPPIINNNEDFTPEFQYETRYFSIYISKNHSVAINVDKISSVNKETANRMVHELIMAEKTEGYVSNFKFKSKQIDDGVLYVFLDCSRQIMTYNSIFISSVVISITCLVIIFITLILLSQKVVKPFVENYNKQKQFITNASHELKTPLAIIKATTEVLEIENGKNEWTESIQEQTSKLSNLTEKLVFLARMDENQDKTVFKEFDYSETVKEVALPYDAVATTKNIKYSLDVEPDISIVGDVSLLGQLASILLDNAFKYVTKDGYVDVKLTKTKKDVILSVKNSAENIDPKQLKKLFERFYRSDDSRNSSTGGFGIGLSIANSIVNAHKGKINAKSQDGNSIEFIAVLPIKN